MTQDENVASEIQVNVSTGLVGAQVIMVTQVRTNVTHW